MSNVIGIGESHEITLEGDLELPEGWELVKLRDVGQWCTGGTPSRKVPAYFGGEIPWVKSGDLNDGLVIDVAESITAAALKNSAAKLLPKGALSVALYGATIGKVGILGKDAATNQACANCILNEALIDRGFVYRYVISVRAALVKAGQGGAQPNISNEILKNWPIPLPPLAEQKRIAAKVEAVLAKVNAARQRLAKVPAILKRFRQSVLSAACSGRLTEDWREEHTDCEAGELLLARILDARRELFASDGRRRVYKEASQPTSREDEELPEGWTWATVSQLARLDVGFAFKSKEFADKGVRLLRGENVEPGALRWTDVRHWPEGKGGDFAHLQVEEGEIILALDRPLISTGLKLARAKRADLPCLLFSA